MYGFYDKEYGAGKMFKEEGVEGRCVMLDEDEC